jgi:hypothetical protein
VIAIPVACAHEAVGLTLNLSPSEPQKSIKMASFAGKSPAGQILVTQAGRFRGTWSEGPIFLPALWPHTETFFE